MTPSDKARRGMTARRYAFSHYYCPLNTLLLPYLRIWPFDKPPPFGSYIGCPLKMVEFHSTFSRHGIAQSLSALALLIWLNENVLFSAISRQAKASKLSLVLWLNENVGFHSTFSRHGIAQSLSALALRIWLNEKVSHDDFFHMVKYAFHSIHGFVGGR